MIKIKLFFVFVCLGASACFTGLKPGNPGGDNISKTISILDQAIKDIEGESAQWRAILSQVAQDIPQQIDETIRTELQNFASRTIADAGVEATCRIDMMGKRAINILKIARAKIKKETPPILSPTFCHVVPSSFSLADNPNSWGSVKFYGYEFDNKDSFNNIISVSMLSESGQNFPIPESYITRTSHYEVSIDLSRLGSDLYLKKITKLSTQWDKQPLPAQGEVGVGAWKPQRKNVPVSPSAISFTPGHNRGDKDFDTGGSEPMEIEVKAELSTNETTIQGRIYMNAHEPRPDYTTASGWSGWGGFYTVPGGWKIIEVRPNTNAAQNDKITKHGQHDYPRPAGEVVSVFKVWGDHGGDEAGSYTRVEASWRTMVVTIEETKPSWLP